MVMIVDIFHYRGAWKRPFVAPPTLPLLPRGEERARVRRGRFGFVPRNMVRCTARAVRGSIGG